MRRDEAWDLVREHVKDDSLRRHMLSVEAAMRWYAVKLQGDVDHWGLAGLLHDFDWEIHPDLERHPRDGAAILRERNCPEEVVKAILSHNSAYTGVERSTPMEFALLACDEITGLLVAAVLVRPSRNIREMEVKSVRKKWKDRGFAAGVDRPHVEEATADFSRACFEGKLDLWTHVGNVLTAMQIEAQALHLDGRLQPGA